MANEMTASKDLAVEMEALVRDMIKPLLNDPRELSVKAVRLTGRITIEVETSQDDVQYVLGRGASNMKAIRQLMKAYSGRYGIKIEVDYVTDRMTRS